MLRKFKRNPSLPLEDFQEGNEKESIGLETDLEIEANKIFYFFLLSKNFLTASHIPHFDNLYLGYMQTNETVLKWIESDPKNLIHLQSVGFSFENYKKKPDIFQSNNNWHTMNQLKSDIKECCISFNTKYGWIGLEECDLVQFRASENRTLMEPTKLLPLIKVSDWREEKITSCLPFLEIEQKENAMEWIQKNALLLGHFCQYFKLEEQRKSNFLKPSFKQVFAENSENGNINDNGNDNEKGKGKEEVDNLDLPKENKFEESEKEIMKSRYEILFRLLKSKVSYVKGSQEYELLIDIARFFNIPFLAKAIAKNDCKNVLPFQIPFLFQKMIQFKMQIVNSIYLKAIINCYSNYPNDTAWGLSFMHPDKCEKIGFEENDSQLEDMQKLWPLENNIFHLYLIELRDFFMSRKDHLMKYFNFIHTKEVKPLHSRCGYRKLDENSNNEKEKDYDMDLVFNCFALFELMLKTMSNQFYHILISQKIPLLMSYTSTIGAVFNESNFVELISGFPIGFIVTCFNVENLKQALASLVMSPVVAFFQQKLSEIIILLLSTVGVEKKK